MKKIRIRKSRGNNEKCINIGCSSNESYAPHLGAMIFSLLENCSCPEKVRIFLMDGGLSENSRKNLNYIADYFKAKLSYHKPDFELLKGLKICQHIGIETYYRFSLINLLKNKKLLYLDADLIVLGDVKELFEAGLKGKIALAVKDPGVNKKKKKALGIPINEKYFNAGVLLIDCKKWGEEKITEKAIKYIRKNPEKIEYADQDGLNAVLAGYWGELHPSWNVITKIFIYKCVPFKKIHDYEKSTLSEIEKNPKIIHYASFVKPWFFLDPSPYKSLYWEHIRKTPWKTLSYPDKSAPGILKRIFYYFSIVINKCSSYFSA